MQADECAKSADLIERLAAELSDERERVAEITALAREYGAENARLIAERDDRELKLLRDIERLVAERDRLREALTNPPRHRYWRPGEPDCPREIKAGNGELHTLRCKVCGLDDPRDEICRATLDGQAGEADRG